MRLSNESEGNSNPNKKKNWLINILKYVGMVIITVVTVVVTAIFKGGSNRKK